jgi:hypothetical protein
MVSFRSSSLHRLVTATYEVERLSAPSWQFQQRVLRPRSPTAFEDALLKMPPFADCPDNHVWDLHTHPEQAFPCADRRQLLGELAGALVLYNSLCCFIDLVPPHEMQQRSIAAIRQLSTVLGHFDHRRQTETLSDAARSKTKGMKMQPLKTALEHLTQLVTSLTQEDYTRSNDADNQFLATLMYNAFVTYGAPARRYSATAIFFSIAAILSHLEIVYALLPDTERHNGMTEATIEALSFLAGALSKWRRYCYQGDIIPAISVGQPSRIMRPSH